MKSFKKSINSKKNLLILLCKHFLSFSKRRKPVVIKLHDIIYSNRGKKRIVVLGNGPSANKLKVSSKDLYLVTNSGYNLVSNMDYIYYVKDKFYIQKLLINSNLFKSRYILMYYSNTTLHLNDFKFLKRFIHMIYNLKIYMLSGIDNPETQSRINYNEFQRFYKKKELEVKIQNSGMFLLLYGFYLSQKMNLPLDIYGLDMGIGGEVHFDGKGVVGRSVTDYHVKKNMKRYLDCIYSELKSDVRNYSNFQTKID